MQANQKPFESLQSCWAHQTRETLDFDPMAKQTVKLLLMTCIQDRHGSVVNATSKAVA